MHISISIVASDIDLQSDFLNLDVNPDMTLSDIKSFIEAEINVPPSSQIFLQDGRPVTDNSTTLAQMNVQEGDVVALAVQGTRQRSQPAQRSTPAQPTQRAPSTNDPEQARLRVLGDPVLMGEWRRQDPELAAAASDRDKFHDLYSARQRQYAQAQREKEEQHALLAADPFNVDAQQKIEEMIRQERVAENLQKAMEENPEWSPCSTSMSPSTMCPSRPSSIREPKPRSCPPPLRNDVASCDSLTNVSVV
ncbi:hypothetical protein EDD37DRAFT_400617 [Exophiala viscosa]|uniref:Ubiquitin-like domain-containing protein n=1 Tax=Exophiala viscosa TaxID=2486360 RepID=A0AAN6E1N2_9EURO|nr:hypothetical protein EDD36DRAFT_170764 [Exophiala viscosa]KAI1624114.1 hypothetical protein EDD37DRAFT_400617 [Exophiala viscosa]